MAFAKPQNLVWLRGLSLLGVQAAAMIVVWYGSDHDNNVLILGSICMGVTLAFLMVLAEGWQRQSRRLAAQVEDLASGDARQRLEALRSDFAANVSHELRTPITNIKGYVETLLEVGVNDAEQTAKFLDVIHRNTERLAFIIEDLLALARLEQPNMKGTLRRAVTPLRPIIDAALLQIEKERSEREIEIEMDLARDLSANVNAQLIEQALGNLLSNSIKYSPPRTKVTIRTALNRRGEIELIVADQGPGIAKEHLPRLFERFYRVDRARSREMGGTGLGLAIVKHIALVHGGRAEVESEVGRGSTFRIILPPLTPTDKEVHDLLATGTDPRR